MPQVTVEIDEAENSINRPLCMDIIKSIVAKTKLPKGIEINFMGALQQTKTQDTDISENPTTNDELRSTFSQRYVKVNAERDYIQEQTLSTGIQHNEHTACFVDKELDIVIVPTRMPTIFSLSFTVGFPDEFSATKWRNNLLRTATLYRKEEAYSATYHYPLARSLILILSHIHKTRENIAPLNEDIKNWFGRCFTEKATVITSQSGNQRALVIRETDSGIIGWFDFTATPEKPVYNKDEVSYEITFQFSFYHDLVVGYRMRYPFIVHNQLLPPEVSPRDTPYYDDRLFQTPSLSKIVGDIMTVSSKDPLLTTRGMSIPYWDDWRLQREVHDYGNILRLLTTITVEDQRTLIDFNDLDSYSIDPFFIPYIQLFGNDNLIPYDSPFLISVYEGDKRLSGEGFELSQNLVLAANQDLSLRKVYHVTFDLILDLNRLSVKAKEKLQENGLLVVKIIDLYDIGNYCVPELSSGKFINNYQWHKMILCVKDRLERVTPQRKILATAGQYIITSRRHTSEKENATSE